MRVQVVVQHDPRRAELLPPLLEKLGAAAQVIADPGAQEALRSPWRCYLACLRALNEEATHLVVVQDDVEVCRDFPRAVEAVIAARPCDPVCLFVPGVGLMAREMLDACYRGERWFELNAREWLPAVACVWPREHVGRILAFAERGTSGRQQTADDGQLGDWMREERVRVFATVPSLCNHPDAVPSLMGMAHFAGLNPGRVAACWVGAEASPAGIDWGR